MFVIASLDEMRITTLLNRQAEAVVAVGLLLDLVVVVGNMCYTVTLVILVLFELTTGEHLPDDTTGTVALVGTVLYFEALLAHHMTRCV